MEKIPGAKLATLAGAVLAGATSIAALAILFLQFRAIPAGNFLHALMAEAGARIVVSLLLTVVSFVALASYDVFAIGIVAPRTVRPAIAFLAGATANAISNTLGFHALTATAVRYRIYNRAGLSVADIARVISLSGAAIGLSFVVTLAAALLVRPLAAQAFDTKDISLLCGGLLLALAVATLVFWFGSSPRTVTLVRFRIAMPSGGVTALQAAIGLVEMLASIGALYVLLPADLVPGFASFSITMVLAMVLAVVSNAPGGLGVFEATVVSLLGAGGRADALAALILYRVLYNLLPTALSLAALAAWELAGARERARS